MGRKCASKKNSCCDVVPKPYFTFLETGGNILYLPRDERNFEKKERTSREGRNDT